MEPISPALIGEFFITDPLGKPLFCFIILFLSCHLLSQNFLVIYFISTFGFLRYCYLVAKSCLNSLANPGL